MAIVAWCKPMAGQASGIVQHWLQEKSNGNSIKMRQWSHSISQTNVCIFVGLLKVLLHILKNNVDNQIKNLDNRKEKLIARRSMIVVHIASFSLTRWFFERSMSFFMDVGKYLSSCHSSFCFWLHYMFGGILIFGDNDIGDDLNKHTLRLVGFKIKIPNQSLHYLHSG